MKISRKFADALSWLAADILHPLAQNESAFSFYTNNSTLKMFELMQGGWC